MKAVLKAGTALAGAAAVFLSAGVVAEESEDVVVEEILITALKRETTLQDTPVAVSAVTGASLERAQIRDVRDLTALVPSLIVNQRASASNTNFSLRGVSSSTFNFGLEPAVGVFVDGVYRSRNGASINDFLGLERVEVLRGPQSTLFGKNTTAGVINFVTKKPEFDWGAEAELTYGKYDAQIAKAGVTGPLVEDKLAIRLDANYNKRDGFIEDVIRDRGVNERDRYGLRGQLLFTPTEKATWRVIADLSDIDENCCAAPFFEVPDANKAIFASLGAVIFDPVDPFNGKTAVDGEVLSEVKSAGLSLEGELEFDGFTVNTITAFRDYDERQNIDPDFASVPVNTERLLDQKYDTFTQELRFTSTTDGPIDWMAGLYYFNQTLQAANRTVQGQALRPFVDGASFSADLLALDPLLAANFGRTANGSLLSIIEILNGQPAGTYMAPGSGQVSGVFDQENRSYSAFAQFDWHMTDKLTLTVGGRYVREEKDFRTNIQIDDPFAALDLQAEFAEDLPVIAALAATGQIIQAGIAGGLPPELAANPAFNPGFAQLPQATALAAQGLAGPLQAGYNALLPLQFFPPAPNVADDLSDDEFLFNVIANYEMSDQFTIYGSYSEGYKAGGFALDSSAVRVGDFQFDAENARSWELGVKARLFENQLALNVALFDQKVENFQANTFTGSAFVPNNAGSINVQGLEVDGAYQITERFSLSGAMAWLWEAEYGSYPNGPCPTATELTANCTLVSVPGSNTFVPVQDLSGARLDEQPKFRGNLVANYAQPISDSLEFFMRAEMSYTSSQKLAVNGDPRQVQDAYSLFAGSIGIGHREGNWSLVFWGRNIFDKDYVIDTFENPLPGNLNAYIGDPATYGLTLRTKF